MHDQELALITLLATIEVDGEEVLDKELYARLRAAASALIYEYAQYPPDSEEYKHYKALFDMGNSEKCRAEVELLLRYRSDPSQGIIGGFEDIQGFPLFFYTDNNRFADAFTSEHYYTLQRIGGVARVVESVAGSALNRENESAQILASNGYITPITK